MMATNNMTSIFLVTANIASCFDKPKIMLDPWLDELFKVIDDNRPQFIALHCQEVGGKLYESSTENVHEFLSNLLKRVASLDYSKARIYIDEDYTSADKFTALGNMYFIRSDVEDIQIWDFHEKKYLECEGIEQYSGSIEDVTTKEKSKFPQEFFPECKWSRKGFMRTRWCINGTQVDFVNIHLFHDASNIIAMETFPSVYTVNRKRAMEHTLDRFHNDAYDNVPFFLFGDFNFRVDTKGVVEMLIKGCSMDEAEIHGEKTCLFKDTEDKLLLSVSKKSFFHANHNSLFMKENGRWLRPFDKELHQFGSRLFEYPILFPPSYPFEEGVGSTDGKLYMKTRCPSWCDRILMSKNAKQLLEKTKADVKYNIIGIESRMGDHKPVGLRVEMPMGAGIVGCCSPPVSCTNFVHVPEASCFTFGAWCHCQAYPKCSIIRDSICSIPHPDTSLSACPVVTSSNVAPNSTNIDIPLLMNQTNYSDLKEPQSKINDSLEMSQISNEILDMNKVDIQLKNMKMHGMGDESNMTDFNLKRVHSDPVKIKHYYDKLKNQIKSNIGISHSLDSQHIGKQGAKLRLRVGSTRLVSHHSSSSEEWFEEMSPLPEHDKFTDHSPLVDSIPSSSLPPDPNAGILSQVELNSQTSFYSEYDSVSVTESILRTPRFVKHDSSLNNLLLNDGSQSQFDNESRSAQSYQTDESSIRADGGSNVIPCFSKVVIPTDPNAILVPEESMLYNKNVPAKSEGRIVEETSASGCCCVLS